MVASASSAKPRSTPASRALEPTQGVSASRAADSVAGQEQQPPERAEQDAERRPCACRARTRAARRDSGHRARDRLLEVAQVIAAPEARHGRGQQREHRNGALGPAHRPIEDEHEPQARADGRRRPQRAPIGRATGHGHRRGAQGDGHGQRGRHRDSREHGQRHHSGDQRGRRDQDDRDVDARPVAPDEDRPTGQVTVSPPAKAPLRPRRSAEHDQRSRTLPPRAPVRDRRAARPRGGDRGSGCAAPTATPSVSGSASISPCRTTVAAEARHERRRPARDRDHGDDECRSLEQDALLRRSVAGSASDARLRLGAGPRASAPWPASSARCAGTPAQASRTTAASSMSCGARPSRASTISSACAGSSLAAVMPPGRSPRRAAPAAGHGQQQVAVALDACRLVEDAASRPWPRCPSRQRERRGCAAA